MAIRQLTTTTAPASEAGADALPDGWHYEASPHGLYRAVSSQLATGWFPKQDTACWAATGLIGGRVKPFDLATARLNRLGWRYPLDDGEYQLTRPGDRIPSLGVDQAGLIAVAAALAQNPALTDDDLVDLLDKGVVVEQGSGALRAQIEQEAARWELLLDWDGDQVRMRWPEERPDDLVYAPLGEALAWLREEAAQCFAYRQQRLAPSAPPEPRAEPPAPEPPDAEVLDQPPPEEAIELLTAQEARDLAEREARIDAGIDTVVEVLRDLYEIRRGRLYRATHRTWPDYLADRWPQLGGVRHLNRQLVALEISDEVERAGLPRPETESQARELARAPEGQRAEVYRQAIEHAGGEAPTARQIRATVEAAKPAPEPPALWPDLAAVGCRWEWRDGGMAAIVLAGEEIACDKAKYPEPLMALARQRLIQCNAKAQRLRAVEAEAGGWLLYWQLGPRITPEPIADDQVLAWLAARAPQAEALWQEREALGQRIADLARQLGIKLERHETRMDDNLLHGSLHVQIGGSDRYYVREADALAALEAEVARRAVEVATGQPAHLLPVSLREALEALGATVNPVGHGGRYQLVGPEGGAARWLTLGELEQQWFDWQAAEVAGQPTHRTEVLPVGLRAALEALGATVNPVADQRGRYELVGPEGGPVRRLTAAELQQQLLEWQAEQRGRAEEQVEWALRLGAQARLGDDGLLYYCPPGSQTQGIMTPGDALDELLECWAEEWRGRLEGWGWTFRCGECWEAKAPSGVTLMGNRQWEAGEDLMVLVTRVLDFRGSRSVEPLAPVQSQDQLVPDAFVFHNPQSDPRPWGERFPPLMPEWAAAAPDAWAALMAAETAEAAVPALLGLAWRISGPAGLAQLLQEIDELQKRGGAPPLIAAMLRVVGRAWAITGEGS